MFHTSTWVLALLLVQPPLSLPAPGLCGCLYPLSHRRSQSSSRCGCPWFVHTPHLNYVSLSDPYPTVSGFATHLFPAVLLGTAPRITHQGRYRGWFTQVTTVINANILSILSSFPKCAAQGQIQSLFAGREPNIATLCECRAKLKLANEECMQYQRMSK